MSATTYNTLEWEMRERERRGEVRSVSSHLGNLSDTALSLLLTDLVDNHDAHRERKYAEHGKRGARVEGWLRAYYAEVQLEMWTRRHGVRVKMAPPRYETKRPVNVLKRACEFAADKQGTVSLGDLQAEYRKIRHSTSGK